MQRRPIDPSLHPEVPGPGRPAPPGYEFAGFRRFELVLRQLGGIASRRELLAATDGDETSFWFALHYGYLGRGGHRFVTDRPVVAHWGNEDRASGTRIAVSLETGLRQARWCASAHQ